MEYLKSYKVHATIDLHKDEFGNQILSFDDFTMVEFDKKMGYSVEIIDDELEFTEPNGCQQD